MSKKYRFEKTKPVIFLTARVHPGELPGSLILNGLIDFIMSPYFFLSVKIYE